MRQLPIIRRLYISTFKLMQSDVQSWMTASMRSKFLPLLWVTHMGLQPQTKPDDHLLLQTVLKLNHVQHLRRGYNISSLQNHLTESEIDSLQNLARITCAYLTSCIDLRVSIKYHSLMWHLSEHLMSFGCRRTGDTDSNETLHKFSKKSYNATNKRLQQLGSQILSLRNAAKNSLIKLI